MLKLDEQKRKGIKPRSFDLKRDVMISFWKSKQEDEDDLENDEEKSIISYFIISRKNRLLGVWYFGYIICCLLSSYFYIYLAAFHQKHSDGTDVWWTSLEVTFEMIFFV